MKMYFDKNEYNSPWFFKNSQKWDKIFYDREFKVVKKDAIIIHQGSIVNDIYFVKEGRIRFSILSEDGEEKTIFIMDKGNIFGDVAAANSSLSSMKVTAVTDCVLYMIESQQFFERIYKDNELLSIWISNMTSTVEYLINHIKDITFLDTFKLVAEYLLKLRIHYGIQTPRGIKLDIHFTHQEMADLIGSSRVTVSKIMTFLKKENMIDRIDGYFYITDLKKLEKFIDSD
ncbi:Crp/Fnr family transcriptional regulator [Thermoanaerobacteraceae bacterium SP2]|nr:Crp/Fnr family transcriptional regulator [Thermoanaerobacteraceae bacterium SP2]